MVINVENRHKDEAIPTEIISCSGTFLGKASMSEINSDDILAVYTFDKREQYYPLSKELVVQDHKMTYSFPAHSFMQIKVKIDE